MITLQSTINRLREPFVLGIGCWVLSGGILIASGLLMSKRAEGLLELDRAVFVLVSANRNPFWDGFFCWATWAGSLVTLAPISVAIIFGLSRYGHRSAAWLLGLSLFGASLMTHLAKLVFSRPRPTPLEPIVAMPTTYSFPSTHSAQITAFVLALLLIKMRAAPDFAVRTVWATLVGVALIMIVGFSRVYLQVHYATDVLAGFLLGGAWSLGLYLVRDGHQSVR